MSRAKGTLVVLLAISAMLAVLYGPEGRVGSDNVVDRFTIDRAGNAVLLPVTIEGKSYPFLLDTGSAYTAIDYRLLKQPPPRGGKEAPSSLLLRFCDTPAAMLGRYDLRRHLPEIMSHDFSPMREGLGVDFYGILGMDFLARRVVQVDFDQGECRFLKRAHSSMGVRTRLYVDAHRRPYVKAVMGSGKPVSFLLDTGFVGPVAGELSPTLTDTLVETGKASPVALVPVIDLESQRTGNIFECPRLAVGEIIVEKPTFFGHGRCDSLGMGFLGRYLVTIDCAMGRVFLQPREPL